MSETTDPRPRVVEADGRLAVAGWRCASCSYPSCQPVAACPVCSGEVRPARFPPAGEVFASTCLRVRVPGHTPPFAMAYVVLDGGPRILTHTPGDQPVPPGTRVVITGVSEQGDPVATAAADGAR